MKKMIAEDLTLIRVWVEGEQKALEWSVGRQTFQISGVRGAIGLYVRHFHKSGHPTRSDLGVEAILRVLPKATTRFSLYSGLKGEKGARYLPTPFAVIAAAKAWLGMPAEEAESVPAE